MLKQSQQMAGRVLSVARSVGGNRLAHFAAAYALTAALQKGIGFVLFLWLAHSLAAPQYAAFGLLFALQAALAALAGAGIVESTIGALHDRPGTAERERVFRSANTAFALLALPSSAFVVVLYFIGAPDVVKGGGALTYVIVSGVLSAFFTLQAALVRLEERHSQSLALSFLAPLAGFVGGGVAFAGQRDVASFFAGTAVGLAVVLIAWRLQRSGLQRFSAEWPDIRPILATVLPFALIAVLGWIGGYGNTYLVKAFFSETDVARFTFAYTLSAVMQLVATSLNQVWSPRFFGMVQRLPLAELERKNRRFFTLQGFALGLIGGALLLLIPQLVELIGGNLLAYRGMSVELFFLFAAYAVSVPCWHAQNYFYAHSMGAQLMRVTVMGSIAGLVAWLLAIMVCGVVGVYVGFMLQMLARAVFTAVYARRQWGIRIAAEGAAIAVVLLAAGAAATSMY